MLAWRGGIDLAGSGTLSGWVGWMVLWLALNAPLLCANTGPGVKSGEQS
jgi:hypothetical protein